MSKYVVHPKTEQQTDPRYVSGLGNVEVKAAVPKWAIALGLGFAWMKFTKSGQKAAKKIGL